MATFADQAEFDKVDVSGKYPFWIGLKRTLEGEWVWNDGKPAYWMKWAIGQPDGKDQNCVYIYAGKWWDADCSSKIFGVVCEILSG